MEFDKTNVYTTVNAVELEKGDVVFVADTLKNLRDSVTGGARATKIENIRDAAYEYRFSTERGIYALAYLIAKHDDPYMEFKQAQAEGKKIWLKGFDGQWSRGQYCDFTLPVDHYSLEMPLSVRRSLCIY